MLPMHAISTRLDVEFIGLSWYPQGVTCPPDRIPVHCTSPASSIGDVISRVLPRVLLKGSSTHCPPMTYPPTIQPLLGRRRNDDPAVYAHPTAPCRGRHPTSRQHRCDS